MNRTIKVTGKGRISVKPDTIRLNIKLEGSFKDYEDTLKHSSESSELLRDAVEQLGYDRKALKTVHFNINTEYESYQEDGRNWKNRFTGYKYAHRMRFEFPADNERLGRVLYALAHCPASPEFSIEYTVANPEVAQNELLGEAVKDSAAKAKVLAESAGVKLGNIVNIDYSWDEVEFVSRPLEAVTMRSLTPESGSYDMDIEPEDIDMTDTVTVIWDIAD